MGGFGSGRFPRPEALRVVYGMRRRAPVHGGLPVVLPPLGIDPPAFLGPVAAAKYRELAATVPGLTVEDEDRLAFYCVAYGNHVKATGYIDATGLIVNGRPNPALKAQRWAADQMLLAGDRLFGRAH